MTASSPDSRPLDSALWAITCYYNPAGYRRRLLNYHEFRRRLTVPLVTVELTFGHEPQLSASAAEVLITVEDASVLWQKERLLNIAWSHVPATVSKIAWIDADVFFPEVAWVEHAARLLEEFPVISLYSQVAEMRTDHDPRGTPPIEDCQVGDSVLRGSSADATAVPLLDANMRVARTHSGLAFAARREAFEGLGFYDACIAGSGNRALLCAQLGRFDDAVRYLRMTHAWERHYRAWATAHHERVQGRVGIMDGTIYHLWHGDLANRRYAERHQELARYHFDPARDIAPGTDGCWRWSSEKPEMHAFLERYFFERREDGDDERGDP